MPGKMIVALLTVLLVAIFAVQNSAPTNIDFLMFDWSVSKALIIIIAAVAGCLVGLIFSMSRSYKQEKQVRHIQKDKTTADAALKEQQVMLDQQKARIEQLQEKLERQEEQLRQQREKTEQSVKETQAEQLRRHREPKEWKTGPRGNADSKEPSQKDVNQKEASQKEASQKEDPKDKEDGLFEKWKDFIKN